MGLAGSASTASGGAVVAGSGGTTALKPQPSGGAGQLPVIEFEEHLYVTDQTENAVYVYDIGPGATDVPSRRISGPKTGLANPQSLAVDKQGALYVVNYRRDITVYPPGANGDVAPILTFATDLHPLSITDPGHPTVVGEIPDFPMDSPFYSDSVFHTEVFVFDDRHQAVPLALKARFELRTLTGGWSWSPTGAYGCSATRETHPVCLQVPMPGPPVYCPSTDVQTCLSEQGAGGSFTLTGRGVGRPSSAVRFRPDGKLVISWSGPDSVGTYTIKYMTGQVATMLQDPSVISGAATGLTQPQSVAFDTSNNMYVLNTGLASAQGSVTVYQPDASGDVSPIRTLGGRTSPFGMAVGP